MNINSLLSVSASSPKSSEIACEIYDTFIQKITKFRLYNVSQEIENRLSLLPNMTLSDKFQQVYKLKAWLDSFRPLPPIVVAELKKLYDYDDYEDYDEDIDDICCKVEKDMKEFLNGLTNKK